MPVSEVRQALGEWSVQLIPGTPRELLDVIVANPFGTIAIVPGPVTQDMLTDEIIFGSANTIPVPITAVGIARYLGVLRKRSGDPSGYTISGSSMNFWLGDEDGKGPVSSANEKVGPGSNFAATINTLSNVPPYLYTLTGQVIDPTGGTTYTLKFPYMTARDELNYFCDMISTPSIPVSWKARPVSYVGSRNWWVIDAGADSTLYTTSPKAMLVRNAAGRDLKLVGYTGDFQAEMDYSDYTTVVNLLAEGQSNNTLAASTSFNSPYLDPVGAAVVITRNVDESVTTTGNASARATLALNRFKNPNRTISLSSDDYDIRGDIQVGDTIYVYDPALGFINTGNEEYWQGQVINPDAYRCIELNWPIENGWSVLFRASAAQPARGTWYDLTPFFIPESGATEVVVGDKSVTLNVKQNVYRTNALARVNQFPRQYCTEVSITPSAPNTPTLQSITFPEMGGSVFRGFASAKTTVPGSTVTGCSVTNVTSTSADVWVTRTNTTATTVNVLIIGTDA